jgi:hypothetical protein
MIRWADSPGGFAVLGFIDSLWCRIAHRGRWRYHLCLMAPDIMTAEAHAGCPVCGRVYVKRDRVFGGADLFWTLTPLRFEDYAHKMRLTAAPV